jgi:DNA invertase Pin-like site-specific DNA recombinase
MEDSVMSNAKSASTSGLRFAALIRVSTPEQEKEGESLTTQKTDLMRYVEELGGAIIEWYGGQEHATPSWEKIEIDRLIADAGRGVYNAVIVWNLLRWSRDNTKSKEGIDAFCKHNIRFFVGPTEKNLYSPSARLEFNVNAAVGEFTAAVGAETSIRNRINRAKRGWPTCGKLPFGRTFDKKIAAAGDASAAWGIDPTKQALVQEVAERYLKGESMEALAAEFHKSHSNLCLVLREQCGETWVQHFRAPEFNIDETIYTPVPRLLPESVIKAVRARLEARRTSRHGITKYDYLLNGFVFCAHCGYTLTGQPNHKKTLYYRHSRSRAVKNTGGRRCPLRSGFPWVLAADLDREVFRDLFEMFGNPAAIERTVKATVPNCDKEIKRHARLQTDLRDLRAGRDRILNLVARGAISEAEAEPQLLDIKDRERLLEAEITKIDALLAEVPPTEDLSKFVRTTSFQPRRGHERGEFIEVTDADDRWHYGGNDDLTLLYMIGELDNEDIWSCRN